MTNWREQILKKFSPGVARLTLVSDPDGLLTEEIVHLRLTQQGFLILEFGDSIEFRYLYESKFRRDWGQDVEFEIIVRVNHPDIFVAIPFDIFSGSRKIELSLSDLFPNLNYNAILDIEPRFYDMLTDAYTEHISERLSENSTKDFVLRHVFGIAPEVIKGIPDLLRALLNRHYKNITIPESIDSRLIKLLRKNKLFDDWPLEEIVPDRGRFFSFLQKSWPDYLSYVAGERSVEDVDILIPFDHDDVRVYIDNLFIEGFLEPIKNEYGEKIYGQWMKVGLIARNKTETSERLHGLIDRVQVSIPTVNAKYQDWIGFSLRYAYLLSQYYTHSDNAVRSIIKDDITEIRIESNRRFLEWAIERYMGLYNLPSVNPVMVHHIPRFIAQKMTTEANEKYSLIVVDGLSLDQWFTLRHVLNRDSQLTFEESAVFAWIPTLTPVSRQAIFAGKAPMFFSDSIETTNKESKLWKKFWDRHNIMPGRVFYGKGMDEDDSFDLRDTVDSDRTSVAAFVLTKIDKIMHGMQLGTAGMHNMVRQWAEAGFILKLIQGLLSEGFRILLTSDHGNIEAVGGGRPMEGAIADVRGERARIYSDDNLRKKVHSEYDASILWSNAGLPEEYYPLVYGGNQAFTNNKQVTVAHGGVSIEEVLVPFVMIDRK